MLIGCEVVLQIAPGRKALKRASRALAVISLLFIAATTQGQAASLAEDAPLNPRFVEHVKARQQGIAMKRTADGHPLGRIPSTLDLSHLKRQQRMARQVSTALPSSYDLRTYSKVTPVRNQGACGSCWAFAVYGSLESRLLPGESRDFSENNLKNLHGFDYSPCEGGMWQMAAAYLARWAGPINESDDPYQATDTNSSASLPPQKHVQDIIVIPARNDQTDNADIKNAVMTYGGVDVGIYWDDSAYNATNSSYYFGDGEALVQLNHDITVVGWDDNYSASNFSSPPPGNGAFLIKNSWGSNWGTLGGYFWISYYDVFFATDTSAVFVGNETAANYTRKYEYDPLGWVSNKGFNGSTTAWFANIFTAVGNEQLQAVATYAASNNSPYVITIYTDVDPTHPNYGTLQNTTSGTFAQAGYHTVALSNPVPLTAGQTFAVVVQLTTPNFDHPIPVQARFAGYSSQATASPGQGFISADGDSWSDPGTGSVSSRKSVALKAFSGPAQASAVASISVNPATVVGGNSSVGTLTLTTAAPLGGSTVALNSNHTAVQVPASASISSGSLSTTFPVTTSVVNTQVVATISAGAAQTSLTLNPVPAITSLSVPTVTAGSSGFTLTISGYGFANGAGVSWNGSDRTSRTTWVDSYTLTLSVSAADIATAGTIDIKVTNPSSAGGVASDPFKFIVDSASSEQGAFTVSSTVATLNVRQGQSAAVQVSFGGTNTAARITSNCVNLPVGASCSYSNGSVSIATSALTPPGSYNIVVIFTATQQMASLSRHRVLASSWLGISASPLGLLWLGYRRRRSLLLCLFSALLAVLFLSLAGCGGAGGAGASAPPTVTSQSSMSLALKVN